MMANLPVLGENVFHTLGRMKDLESEYRQANSIMAMGFA